MQRENEEWMNIEEFPDYDVSNYGRIIHLETDRILKPCSNQGYYYVSLRKEERRITKSVHRIVAKAFLDSPANIHATTVDHIDRVRSNNNVSNLRYATVSQQSMNKNQQPSRFGYKGVSYRKKENLYRARICLNGKKKELGDCRTPEEAAKRYNAAALKYFGEFAVLNDV